MLVAENYDVTVETTFDFLCDMCVKGCYNSNVMARNVICEVAAAVDHQNCATKLGDNPKPKDSSSGDHARVKEISTKQKKI